MSDWPRGPGAAGPSTSSSTLPGAATLPADAKAEPGSGPGMLRRHWIRFSDEPVLVSVQSEHGQVKGLVVDESFGGIGIELDRTLELEINDEVEVQYRTGPMIGRVRFISTDGHGRFRIGVEWRKPRLPYI